MRTHRIIAALVVAAGIVAASPAAAYAGGWSHH